MVDYINSSDTIATTFVQGLTTTLDGGVTMFIVFMLLVLIPLLRFGVPAILILLSLFVIVFKYYAIFSIEYSFVMVLGFLVAIIAAYLMLKLVLSLLFR